MAKKVSELASATTPLGGTELALVVQSGVSKKVAVGDILGTKATLAMNEAVPVSIASSATPAIGAAAANTITITGSSTITGFDTIAAGARRTLVFAGALTLTHNATSLILPGGGNILTAAGDSATVISLGSGNWRCTSYSRASGKAVNTGQGVVTALGTSGVVTVDCSLGEYFTLTPTAAVTGWSFTNVPTGYSCTIVLTQGGTPYNVAMPTAKWAGGTPGAFSTAASAEDELSLSTTNGGTSWRAAFGQAFS